MTNAPAVAVKILAILKSPVLPKPKNEPKKPPTKDPAIPKAIVINQPPPSLPGISYLASAPAIKPNIIHEIIPISNSLLIITETTLITY